jgi:hypothetical protein
MLADVHNWVSRRKLVIVWRDNISLTKSKFAIAVSTVCFAVLDGAYRAR